MRSPFPRAFRPRRALAVAGLVTLGSGLLMLTAAVQPVQAAPGGGSPAAARHQPAAVKPSRAAVKRFEAQVKQPAAARHSPTTKTGPHLYNPLTGKPFKNASSVTITQTASLVNQQVQVSWANFTPSGSLFYNNENTTYPVMVAECKGTNPSSPADCYGATGGGVSGTAGPYGPINTAFGTTGPNGTGLADIEVLTKVENQFLGCERSHPCSLAIVPAQGGAVVPPNKVICKNHSEDAFTAVGAVDFGSTYFACSWAQRIVVPITFAPTAANCPFRNPAFSAAGSPMLDRAMESWITALCAGSHGMTIAYDSTVAEPLALADLGTKQTDVALTTRPAGAQQGISTGTKHYVYAPVAVSAVSIAYWFDSPVTGLPQTGVKLDQALLLKLLTQSYAFENDGCPPEVAGTPCDKGVDHDPLSLFSDPDFQRLNPGVQQPIDGGIEVPTVASGNTDTTWTVTDWIDTHKAAAAFLAGEFDSDGNHIDTYYLGMQYPTNSFIGMDPFPLIAHQYTPVLSLAAVAGDQVENWPPATYDTKDQYGNYDRIPPQVPGERALIAIVDEGDSAAFLFPSAKLPNGRGEFVAPTTASMTAALHGMTSEDGTKQVNVNTTGKDAYPLTMVIYAAVPTSGISHAKAAAIARFLDFTAGRGQTPGVQPGQLPPGFAPLPASMRAQTRKDAVAVLDQTGDKHSKSGSGSHSGTGSSTSSTPSPAKSPGAVSLPSVSPSPSSTGSGISLVPAADVRPASITRYILPALLILGGLAALAGSSSLIGSSSTPISARLRRVSEGSKAWGRAARSRLRLTRSK